MARKLESGEGDGRGTPVFGRRAYVKLGATTIAGLGVTASLPSAAADDHEYERIELAAGEQRAYTIGDGESFENVLIDQTASGAMFALRIEEGANDWAIRNVGWKGVAPDGASNREYTFLINARGNGTIENVFIDQRSPAGGSDVGGIWTYSDSHHGHIECRHNFIAGCGNNASYPSGDGWAHNAATGTIEHIRSYHRDNTVANFRPGRPGSRIRECVSVVNDPAGTRGTYPSTDSRLSRAVWAWHHDDIVMENCAIWHDPHDVQPALPFWATRRDGSGGSTCELTIVDCDLNAEWEDAGLALVPDGDGGNGSSQATVHIDGLGTDPDVSVLGDGVPTTPEMAASGNRTLPPELGTAPSGGDGDPAAWSYESADGTHTDLPLELVIEHHRPGTRVRYQIEIDGDAEVGEWEHNARLDGGIATGEVGPTGGLDNIYFDGSIVRFDAENADAARYYLADAQERRILDEVTPDDFPLSEQEVLDEAATAEHAVDTSDADDGAGEYRTLAESSDTDAEVEGLAGINLMGGLASIGAAAYMISRRFGHLR